jgi:hypothetical protein
MRRSKTPSDPPVVEYGNQVASQVCSVTVTQYGSKMGDHVVGTFTAELDRTFGSSPIQHMSLTNGQFDLVQYYDVPH